MSSKSKAPALKPAKTFDYITKANIVGDPEVGKTSLMLRYCDDKFMFAQKATLGVDFGMKDVEVDKKKMKLHIWDTAGQERFRSITLSYFQNVHGVMLAYAVNRRESFIEIEYWMNAIKKRAPEDVCIILVGTKIDVDNMNREQESFLEPRSVSFSEGQRLAYKYNARFFETSSKDGTNVNEAFEALNEEIYKVIKKRQEKEPMTQSVMIRKQKRRSGGGCLSVLSRFFARKGTNDVHREN